LKGYFSLVLHTHMPYVRKNGAFPVGEDWIYQVMSDTYLPMLDMLCRLENEGVSNCLALTLTPVLCEQLADQYIGEKFVAYLKTMAKRTDRDIQDFIYFQDAPRKAIAEGYLEGFQRKLAEFLAIDGDMLAAIRGLESSGMIETLACSATHAFLPAMADWRSVRYQVQLGLESHRRRLGVNPAGFWMPECAYRQGLEKLLESEGVRYVPVDPSALCGPPSARPCLIEGSAVAALARSDRAHLDVWDEQAGYPTDDWYLDSTKYYHNSGLLYWRVTGPAVSIEDKAVYEPERASRRALDHAGSFIEDMKRELAAAESISTPSTGEHPHPHPGPLPSREREEVVGPGPLVLASYDTELFGHGWREGFYWMEILLRSLAASGTIAMTTPARYLDSDPPSRSATLRETTWGTDKDASTWVNTRTEWMWRQLDSAQAKLFELLARFGTKDGARQRILRQAAREVLLMESSDWPYMVAKDRASNYATQRFNTHDERFWGLARALEQGDVSQAIKLAAEVEEVDNIFAELDLGVISGEDIPGGTEGR
jgi:1,4-alpha-glucan branching enzyme